MEEYLQNCTIQELHGFADNIHKLAVLRLDLLHPVVSGNKWFKLRYYLEDALSLNKKRIATFGGAYSNHIVAAAFAAGKAQLSCTGYIRGDADAIQNPTLLQARSFGMEIVLVSRDAYREKDKIIEKLNGPDTYWINEGGYGPLGAKGAATILDIPGTGQYSHILCATGSGTMMAGLVKAARPGQEIIGVSVLKNHLSLETEVRALLDGSENSKPFSFIHGYHFGGYARHPRPLMDFMKEAWERWRLPTDIVYTSKLLFAVKDLVSKSYFPPGSKVLVIHSGGLQGNNSLPPNTLAF